MTAKEKEKQLNQLEKELSAACYEVDDFCHAHWDYEYNVVYYPYRGRAESLMEKADAIYNRIERLKAMPTEN